MNTELLDSFISKADEYLETANSDSITYHDIKVNELLGLATKIHSNIISLYKNSALNQYHKLVVLHLLDRLEYKFRHTRKGIPYPVSELKKVFLNAIESKNEALRFQAVKCSSIAESIAKEYDEFGDIYFHKLYDLLRDDSARIRETVLFLLSCNVPDSKTRSLPSVTPLKKILSKGYSGEYFQALQYLKGDNNLYNELIPDMSKLLKSYDGKYKLEFPEVFAKYLSKNEVLDFVIKSIEFNTIYSLSSVLNLLTLQVYPEIKSTCEKNLNKWYENFPELRTRITEIATKLEIPLSSTQGNQIHELPENEFLAIVSNKRVEGTLSRIIKLFHSNAILISRGDGGFDILSAISYYTMEEI
jgi:hypothetical protein